MSELAGKSVLDLLWEHLDDSTDELMAAGELANDIDRGYARGFAHAIALVTNPYHPDIDAVRADAVERWELRQGVAEPVRTHNERTAVTTNGGVVRPTLAERRARRLARRNS